MCRALVDAHSTDRIVEVREVVVVEIRGISGTIFSYRYIDWVATRRLPCCTHPYGWQQTLIRDGATAIGREVPACEIAPGVDLEKDVLAKAGVPLLVSPDLQLMSTALFCPEPMGLILSQKPSRI